MGGACSFRKAGGRFVSEKIHVASGRGGRTEDCLPGHEEKTFSFSNEGSEGGRGFAEREEKLEA